jgi:SPP1 gp7 family putative phage head morphogenesis protein
MPINKSNPTDLLYAIGLPPEKAIEYFKSKGYTFSWDWYDTWQEAHAKAFTVAKVMRMDVLQDIRGMVQVAIDKGITFQQFKKELELKLQAKGWWGRKVIGDETGAKEVQLGSPHRLKTIYQTNLQTAYNAGRWKEQMENVDNRPYLQYVAVMDKRTRPAHAALNGKVFRADDPFWNTHYPPLGFRCRCRCRALSGKNLKDRGLAVESSKGRLTEQEVLVSKKTGELRPVTVYRDPLTGKTIAPDVGFNYNPGKEWSRWDKKGSLPDCIDADFSEFAEGKCIKIVTGQKTWKDYGRHDLRHVSDDKRIIAPELLKAAQTSKEATTIMLNALELQNKPYRIIETPIEQVILRSEFIPHLVEKRTDLRERYVNFLIPSLTNPYEIYLTEYEDGFRERYIGLFTGKENLLVVVRLNKDGSLLWNIMQAGNKAMNYQRIGALLYGK